MVKSCVIYLTKNLHRFPDLANAWIAPKIYQHQPQTGYSEYSRFYPNWFTFGGVTFECVNTVRALFKVNPIFGYEA